MKKFLFSISTGFLCFLISCNNNAAGDKNLSAAREVNKAIESGDLSKLGDYIAADAVDHAGEHGDVKGLDSIKANLAKMHSMMTDMKSETLKEFADGEHVIQWMRFTGTCAVPMGPSMPAGTKMDMVAVEVSKFKDGKAVEHWEYMDMKDMMKMMGGDMSNMGMDGKMAPPTIDTAIRMDAMKK